MGVPAAKLFKIDARAQAVMRRIQAIEQNVLVVAHRDILRLIIARWVGLAPLDARRLYLETASISVLGYHPGRSDPVIRSLNLTGDGSAR